MEEKKQHNEQQKQILRQYPSPMYTIHTIPTPQLCVLRESTQRTYSHTLTPTRRFNCLSMALELVLLDGESHLEQVLLLLHVGGLETSGDGSTGVAASVHDVLPVVVLGVVEKSLDPGLGE
jgi:hypothetical protein